MPDKKKHHHQDIHNNHALNDAAKREAKRIGSTASKKVPKNTAPDQNIKHKNTKDNNLNVHAYETPKPYDSMHYQETKQTHNFANRRNTDLTK